MADQGRGATPASLWGALLVGGIIAVIIGLVVVFNPFDSVRFLTVIVGISLVVAGAFGIVAAIRGTAKVGVAGPIVALIGGLVLVFLPAGSVKTAAVVVGIVFLAFGVVTIVAGLAARKETGWGPVLGGFVLAILGLIVVVWPGPTLSLIAVLVGISVFISGVSMIAQALRLRSAKG